MTDYSKPDLASAELIRVYACYTNTDLTEGKGYQVSYAWAKSITTAKRLAHKKGVMGTDAEVQEIWAIKIGNVTYVPKPIESPTREDSASDATIAAFNERRETVAATMRDAGFTEFEINRFVRPPL